jgi:outer membrane protein OmpA-like peptidoglycan-associated protein
MAAQRDAGLAQQQAGDAERRAAALQVQLNARLSELNAKKTDRGMVVTIGDVLFDTGQSQIKSGGLRSMDKLVSFMQAYPQRRAMIEGFTDSVGSDDLNQALSSRRADAVRMALVGMGVASDRLAAKGYGEAFPVAGNESSGGRQMNRRVEIVLSDDGGVVAPR